MILSLLLGTIGIFGSTQEDDYTGQFEKLVILKNKIAEIHASLDEFYPVALVRDNSFLLYDFDSKRNSYVFIKKVKSEFPVAPGIRASFPFSFYDNKTGCVVSPDVFDSLEGYATIFHEFVHCFQAKTVEYELKNGLKIHKEAMEKKQYSWELEYDFPYSDKKFIAAYKRFLQELARDNPPGIFKARKQIKDALNERDHEYLVWQEWKEGFARYIENKIRSSFMLEKNQGGNTETYNRIIFYYAGEKFIHFLFREKPELEKSLKLLFAEMFVG